MGDMVVILAMAIDRLGGTLVITEDEFAAFDETNRHIRFDIPTDGTITIELEDA